MGEPGLKNILIASGNKETVNELKKALKKEFDISTASSSKRALHTLLSGETNLVIMDINLPEQGGLGLLSEIRKSYEWNNIPVIIFMDRADSAMESECIARGADGCITMPIDSLVVRYHVNRALELYAHRYRMYENLDEKESRIGRMTLKTIITIANTVDAKDKYTGGHSIRVAKGARAIAEELAWSEEDCRNIYNIAMLHDIGKIAIPDSILNKAGRLNDPEEKIMRQHPSIGYEIVKRINYLEHLQEGVYYHHERWDGNGYPEGLKGENIPIVARIISISDSYDAMNSDRVYRKRLDRDKIIERFEAASGTQFDPKLTELFVNMLKNGFSIDSSMDAWEDMEDKEEESLLLRMVNEYNSNLQISSENDPLTGLYNREYMRKKVDGMLIDSENGVFFMIDLDDFKSVNDTHGHIVGDLLLKMYADVIKKEFRDTDVLCRYGGDEFAIFLPGSPDRENLKKKAKAILEDVAARPEIAHYNIKNGLSIGIATSPEDGSDFDSLKGSADKALYFVKENGKNNFHFYGSEKADRTKSKVDADIEYIKQYLEEGATENNGLFTLKYDEFKNIYRYLDRYSKRKATDIQIVLFTLVEGNHRHIDLSIAEETMRVFERAASDSLRRADVGSVYSNNQYVLILLDTDRENGECVANRVIEKFIESCPYEGVNVDLEIESMANAK